MIMDMIKYLHKISWYDIYILLLFIGINKRIFFFYINNVSRTLSKRHRCNNNSCLSSLRSAFPTLSNGERSVCLHWISCKLLSNHTALYLILQSILITSLHYKCSLIILSVSNFTTLYISIPVSTWEKIFTLPDSQRIL